AFNLSNMIQISSLPGSVARDPVCFSQCAWGPTPTRSRSGAPLRVAALRPLAPAAGALPFTFYLLPFTFYLLPFAFCLLPFAFGLYPPETGGKKATSSPSLNRVV